MIYKGGGKENNYLSFFILPLIVLYMLKKILYRLSLPSVFHFGNRLSERKRLKKELCHSSRFLFFKIILWALAGFCSSALGKTDREGYFLMRGLSPNNLKSFNSYSELFIHTTFYPSNELKVQSQFLFPQFYGEAPLLLKSPIKVYPSASWLIHENIQLKLGRNIYNNLFHQIVSSNPYEASLYSFDGVFLEYSASILNANIWSAYLPKRWIGLNQEQGLRYGMGFFLDIKLKESYIDSFNFHVAYLTDSLSQSSSEKMSRYGLALKGSVQPLQLNYTFIAIGHGSGFQFKMEENMYHLALDYFRPDFLNSRFFTGYHIDSPQYDPWLYDRHKNAGLSDMFLWGNLNYYFAGLSLSPLNRLDIKLIFYNFSATQKGSIQLGYFGAWTHKQQNNSISVSQQKLGKELDLQIKSQISKEFQIKLTTGFFFSHISSKDFLEEDSLYNNIQLAGLYKF